MNNSTKQAYERYGVDIKKAMERTASIPVSLHIWQGDDVIGFESHASALSGGIQTTGNYPYRARNSKELMEDLDFVLSLIPGKKRLNLHASYLITGRAGVDRDTIEPEDFEAWVAYAKQHDLGLDFNPTCFSHPMVVDNLTLSSPKEEVRSFWVRHVRQCRKISAYFAQELGTYSLCNLWIPDGYKDIPADKLAPRMALRKSLDEIYDTTYPGVIDSVESKVFGIGLEAYTVGSSEFYLSYAASHQHIYPLIDSGHYHPTEDVSDKLSALLPTFQYIPLHVTRPMRWDSDHVVRLDDNLQAITDQIVSMDAEKRILIGLDYFDASINRTVAWALGARNTQKALLRSTLTPWALLKEDQRQGDLTSLLSDGEMVKALPWSEVWDAYCAEAGVPLEKDWLMISKRYEKDVLSKRG